MADPLLAKLLHTPRLELTPLQVTDAGEMMGVLGDPVLYEFTGGTPPSFCDLESRYRAQVSGAPDDGELWLNWIVRLADPGTAVGFVQATVVGDDADLAWVIGVPWQGHGIAGEAAQVMRRWLTAQGVKRFTAHIHPDHDASAGVARTIGLQPTGETDDEGELIWAASGD